uniref:RNA-directed DNA polymerase from mobile element jockey n=1 Tax=Lygus hesperus TaxID=30085 RepID=A0A0A9VQR0_LYGHE
MNRLFYPSENSLLINRRLRNHGRREGTILRGKNLGSSMYLYCPVPLWPTLGKLVELHVVETLTEYLLANNFIGEEQYAYVLKKGMERILLDYLDAVYEGVDGGCTVLSVFMDLSKAFDSLHVGILIDLLREIWVVEFEYLENGEVMVKLDGTIGDRTVCSR